MAAQNILNVLNNRDQGQVFGRELKRGEIRLIELEHSVEKSPAQFRCRMTGGSLQARPFIAISYCWGDLSPLFLIRVNGIPYKVTRNVVNILGLLDCSARPSGQHSSRNPANQLRRRLIWIDAICINQQNVAERQMQMSMMKSIYEQALSTMLYLGYPPRGEGAAKPALDWLSSLVTEPLEQFTALSKEVQLQRWNDQSWILVTDLLNKSRWFRRRWTVQEAAVSREVWLVYGAELLKWDIFADAIERAAYMWSGLAHRPFFQTQTEALPVADISVTKAIAGLRARLKMGLPPPQLLEMLLNFRRCGCMYSRERIFALVGLCNDVERRKNEVDLSLDPTATFTRFVISYIDLHGNLDILCSALEIARLERKPFRTLEDGLWVDPDPPDVAQMELLPDLPSWVPNFTSFRVHWLLGPQLEVLGPEFKSIFSAAYGCPDLKRDLSISKDRKVLSVTGIEIDRVAAFHPDSPIAHPNQNANSSPHWWNYWYWTQQGSRVPDVYPSHDARWTAFLRTISAGGTDQSTNRILSDAYLKFFCQDFFHNTLLGQLWRDSAGLQGSLPPKEEAYYLQPWPEAPRNFLPPIAFNNLCFFKFIRGMSGHIGLAPPRTQPMDRIVVLFGCSSPLLLQEVPGSQKSFRIRGEAYMHGFMLGEAIQYWRQGLLPSQRYNIV